MRGERVQAMPYNNGKQQTALAQDVSIAFKDAQPVYSNAKSADELKVWLNENIDKGRYIFSYRWDKRNGEGHVLMFDRNKSKLRVHNPQIPLTTSVTDNEEQINQFLNWIDYNQPIQLLRVDSLDFNEDKINLVYRKQL